MNLTYFIDVQVSDVANQNVVGKAGMCSTISSELFGILPKELFGKLLWNLTVEAYTKFKQTLKKEGGENE